MCLLYIVPGVLWNIFSRAIQMSLHCAVNMKIRLVNFLSISFDFNAVYHAQVYCCCLNCAACPIFCFCCDVWISGGMTKRKKPSCCILSLCAASCWPCSGPRAPISLQFFSYYSLGKRFNYTYTVVILLSPDSNGTWTVSCCTCEVFTAEGRSEDGRVRWGKDGNLAPRIRRAPSDMWPRQQA